MIFLTIEANIPVFALIVRAFAVVEIPTNTLT